MKFLTMLLLTGKLSKVLLTGGTMLLSLVTYAWVFGWRYAAGLVGLLFAHEMGHYLAARYRHLNVGAPCFIPFVGAWIDLKEQPMDAETEAFVAIAGPIVGSVAAFACYLVGSTSDSPWLIAIAYGGFFLNLFNLIPVSPLDGGRIMAAISPLMWLIGFPLLIGLFLWHPSPMLIMIAILAVPQVWTVLRSRDVVRQAYYQVPGNVRIGYAAQYLVLVGFLGITTYELHTMLGVH